jgi:signal transduction histidine kinase
MKLRQSHKQVPEKKGYVAFAIDKKIIFRRLNFLALFVCLVYPVYLLLTGSEKISNAWPSLFRSFLPALICILIELLICKKKIRLGIFLAYFAVPVSVAVKASFEPLPGLMLYPLAQGIVCFFSLRTSRMVFMAYTVSFLSFAEISFYYSFLENRHFYTDLPLMIFSYLLFAFLIYYMLYYIRRVLIRSFKENKDAREELAKQNILLSEQKGELVRQGAQLQYKHTELIRLYRFQNRIAAVLSHDVRTSIHAVHNIFSIYSKGMITRDQLFAMTPELGNELEKMELLFNDIIDWLKEYRDEVGENNKIHFSIYEVVSEVFCFYEFLARQKQVRMTTDIGSEQLIFANLHHIKTVIRNLVSNALKFTQNGAITVTGALSGKMYKILIRDTGTGMTADNLDKVRSGLCFSTSGTGKETGSGLGLSFCRDFIRAAGGVFEVDSEPGKGSCFAFTIPVQCDTGGQVLQNW